MKITARLICAALAVALLIALGSCAKTESEVPDGYKLADAGAGGGNVLADGKDYYFYVPSSWTVDMNNTATSAYVSASDPASVSVMTWATDVTDATPKDLWDHFIPDFESVYSDFAIESEEDTTLGGAAARSVTFTGSLGSESGAVAYRFRQVSAVKGSIVYVVTYTNLASRYDEHKEDFDSILGYFRFK